MEGNCIYIYIYRLHSINSEIFIGLLCHLLGYSILVKGLVHK